MDIWLLLCMMFVALATFEYAVLLAIWFGKGKNICAQGEVGPNKEDKCNKMDRISLKIFFGIYIFTVGSYFFTVFSLSN